MNDARTPPVRADQVVMRLGILLGSLGVVASTRGAGDDPVLVLDVIIVGLALVCTAIPDSHAGLLVTAIIAANWLAAVDDTSTPWAVGAAASLALLHTSMAAASVAPLAAGWTPAMRRRWGRRFVIVAVTGLPTWALVVAVERADIGASTILMAGALLLLATAGTWATAHARPSR